MFCCVRVLQVKTAYISFLNHCYVDTEVEMKEIYTSKHMWTLFEDFLVDMAMVGTLPAPRLSPTTHKPSGIHSKHTHTLTHTRSDTGTHNHTHICTRIQVHTHTH